MAYLDSADLVRRMKVRLRRPTTDFAFTVTTTDDILYDCLTEAQDSLTKLIGTFVPDALRAVPTLLTTSDGGLTYGFGTDTDGAAIFAFGSFVVYPDQASVPDMPLVPNEDYLVEGAVLRMPNNTVRAFSSGPYAQYVAPSNVITSSVQPTVPKFTRLALLSDACARAAHRLEMDPTEHQQDFDRDWAEVLAAIRKQANGKSRPLSTVPGSRTSRWRYQRGR